RGESVWRFAQVDAAEIATADVRIEPNSVVGREQHVPEARGADVTQQLQSILERQVEQDLSADRDIPTFNGRDRCIRAQEPMTRVAVACDVLLDDLRHHIDAEVLEIPSDGAQPIEVTAADIHQTTAADLAQKFGKLRRKLTSRHLGRANT